MVDLLVLTRGQQSASNIDLVAESDSSDAERIQASQTVTAYLDTHTRTHFISRLHDRANIELARPANI